MAQIEPVREHVLDLLRRTTERRFEDALKDFPLEFANTNPPHVEYTPYGLLEHLRISLWDILEYSRNPHYVSPPHPQGYWPAPGTTADAAMWQASLEAFRRDREEMAALLADPKTDLVRPMPHTPGHTILREAMLVIQHSQYHLGEFGILRQVMGTWPSGHV
jgi:hypothetical protein